MDSKNKVIKLSEILRFLDKQNIKYFFQGNEDEDITGFSSLNNYRVGTMTWIKSENNSSNVPDIKLGILDTGSELKLENCIIVSNSKNVFFKLIDYFFSDELNLKDIGEGSYISPTVTIGRGSKIGYNCVLDGNISIGDNTIIHNNVVIVNHVRIGHGCEIQSGVIIGQDGFGYIESVAGKKDMVKHYGGVVIGDDVHISANCNIARGTIDDTIIGNGCKLDALCHIAHNVVIGDNVTLIAGAIVYGSVTIGCNSYVSGCIIKNQLKVGDNAVIGMGSIVIRDVECGAIVAGNPAKILIKK